MSGQAWPGAERVVYDGDRHGAAAKTDEQQGSGYEVCDHRQDERH